MNKSKVLITKSELAGAKRFKRLVEVRIKHQVACMADQMDDILEVLDDVLEDLQEEIKDENTQAPTASEYLERRL